MDKLWIVFLFLGVFLLGNNLIKRLFVRFMSSDENRVFVTSETEAEDDPGVLWNKRGLRREPEKAEFDLPEEDFFENEKIEFSENFEDEFGGLSEEEAKRILQEAGLYEKEGEAF